MSETLPLPPAERFARLIEAMCRALAAHGLRRGLPGPLTVLIWQRLRAIALRFAARLARGRAVRPASGRTRPTPPQPAEQAPPPERPKRPRVRLLPENFAWLSRLLPEVTFATGELRRLLDEADMQALIASGPHTGRALRPLCRMLAIPLPPLLRRPPPR